MFQTKIVVKFKTHFRFNTLSIFSRVVYEMCSVEKYFIAGQVTGDDVAHARCMLGYLCL